MTNGLPSQLGEQTSPVWSKTAMPDDFQTPVMLEGPGYYDWTEKDLVAPESHYPTLNQQSDGMWDQTFNIDPPLFWTASSFDLSTASAASASHMVPPPAYPSQPREIRCYEHGCGGRRFSSIGNYRRHIKEQNGYAKKFPCETCGKTFTRSTARNEHQKQHFANPKAAAAPLPPPPPPPPPLPHTTILYHGMGGSISTRLQQPDMLDLYQQPHAPAMMPGTQLFSLNL